MLKHGQIDEGKFECVEFRTPVSVRRRQRQLPRDQRRGTPVLVFCGELAVLVMEQSHVVSVLLNFASVFVDYLVSLAALLQTFHTPSLGDEVFELPPISLDPDPTLSISDGVSHFALTDGTDGTDAASSSQSLRSNLVVEANDPSFASTYVNSSSRGLEHLGTISQAGDGALLSSSALVSASEIPAR